MPSKKVPTIEVGNAKLVDLRAFLKDVGLDSKGNKPELEKRVKDYLKKSTAKGKAKGKNAAPAKKATAKKAAPAKKATASATKSAASKSTKSAKTSKSKAASASASEEENFAKLSVMKLKELVLERRKDVTKADFEKYKFQKDVLIDFLENGKKAKWPEEKKTAKKSTASSKSEKSTKSKTEKSTKSKTEKSTKSKTEKKKASPKRSKASKSKTSASEEATSEGGKYDQMTLAQLKKECTDRRLNIAKSCANKKTAIASLEAHDAGKKEGLVYLKDKPSKSTSSKGGRGKKASAASSQESSEETPSSESDEETPKSAKPKTPPKKSPPKKSPPKKVPPKLPPKGVHYMKPSDLKAKLDDMGLTDLKSEAERRGIKVPGGTKRDRLVDMIVMHNKSIKDCPPNEFLNFETEECETSTPHYVLEAGGKKIYSSDLGSLETLRDTIFGGGNISEAEHRESISRIDVAETPRSRKSPHRTPPPKPPKPGKMDISRPPTRPPPPPPSESSSSSEEEMGADAKDIVALFTECLGKQT
jgi:hypothetical protein